MSYARLWRITSTAGAVALVLWSCLPLAAQERRVNREAALMAEFTKRIQAYFELHRKLEGTLPPRPDTATATELEAYQTKLAGMIARARPDASQGDFFTREIRGILRGRIHKVLSGPNANQIVGEIMDENPGRIRLRVNARYPDEVPRSTMPTEILSVLPKLPEDLEYRFLGDRLILLDIHANIVLDHMDDAIPD